MQSYYDQHDIFISPRVLLNRHLYTFSSAIINWCSRYQGTIVNFLNGSKQQKKTGYLIIIKEFIITVSFRLLNFVKKKLIN